MKEKIVLELDNDLLTKLLNRSKSEGVQTSALICNLLNRFFLSGDSLGFDSYPVRQQDQSLDDYLKIIEKFELERAMVEAKTKTEASEKLGISYRSFRYRCDEHKISPTD